MIECSKKTVTDEGAQKTCGLLEGVENEIGSRGELFRNKMNRIADTHSISRTENTLKKHDRF